MSRIPFLNQPYTADLLNAFLPHPADGELWIPQLASLRAGRPRLPFDQVVLSPESAPLLRDCARGIVQQAQEILEGRRLNSLFGDEPLALPGTGYRITFSSPYGASFDSESGRRLKLDFPWKNWKAFEVCSGWTGLSQTVAVQKADRIRTKGYRFAWREGDASLDGFRLLLGLAPRASLAQVALEATNWIYASGPFTEEEWGGAPILHRTGAGKGHWENRSLRWDGEGWTFPGRDAIRGTFSISIASHKPFFRAETDMTDFLELCVGCPENRGMLALNPALMSLWKMVREDFLF